MQRFKDTVSGQIYDFDDSVVATVDQNGAYTFSENGFSFTKVPNTLQPAPNESDPVISIRSSPYIPVSLIRTRLQASGLWADATLALAANPDIGFWFLTLEQGVLSTDQTAIDFLIKIGADPDKILAIK